MSDFVAWHVVASLILVAIAVAISMALKLRLAGTLVWASARAAAQLVLIGFALLLVFESSLSLLWAWVWVVAMVAFATFTFRSRAPEVPAGILLPAAAFTCAAGVGIAVIFGLGIFDLTARALVPITGMIIGNALATSVLVGRRVIDDVRDKRLVVESRLALGLEVGDAVHPIVRDSIRTALIPQIETTKAVGVVVLPGMMTGLILAGADPIDAVAAQLAIMYLILGGAAVTSTMIALGMRTRLFTPDARLVRLATGK